MVEGLYSILKQNISEVSIKLTSDDHPIFQAHFPHNPILPGFALIDIMAKIFDDSIIRINKSKFIAHLLPNDVLICKSNKDGQRRNIKIFKNKEKVTEISYETE
jgi:3-hydroxyacyl-[acyl-carrier-protein] dehydratase